MYDILMEKCIMVLWENWIENKFVVKIVVCIFIKYLMLIFVKEVFVM